MGGIDRRRLAVLLFGAGLVLAGCGGGGGATGGPGSGASASATTAAADDPPFADAARALYRTIPGRNKKLVVLEGGGHGTSLVEFGDHAPRVRKLLDQFLAATLGGG